MKKSTTILYAEDEDVLAGLVLESLEKKGYECIHVTNGQDGLDALKESPPALCILDVMMPVMDGFTMAKEIRSLYPYLPILFLTAKSTTADVVQGFELGANDYLRKPFSLQELHARIKNLVRQVPVLPAESGNEIISFGSFQYKSVSQELIANQVTQVLSYREHELLMKLLLSNKEIVNRRQLLLDIWGDDSFFNSRNLDVYVRKLRKHLVEDDSVQIITLKGVGYRFVY
ncbi:UNVERIFIED_CONTAM: hypothetical protein GTU68_059350 [Idotea baltica]|nr:hypothetical protein [Idotea baltica]